MKRHEDLALFARSVEYGERDLVVTFLTAHFGKVAALARGARKSSRRLGGALEPFHTIEIAFEEGRTELAMLREAQLVRVRAALVRDLDSVQAAGVAIRWARHLFPPRTVEPRAWQLIIDLLDALDARLEPPRVSLARALPKLLAEVGYALELERCIRCGRPCPEGRAACFDASRGGLVCQACGGAGRVLDAQVRVSVAACQRGEAVPMDAELAEQLLALTEDVIKLHAGFEP